MLKEPKLFTKLFANPRKCLIFASVFFIVLD